MNTREIETRKASYRRYRTQQAAQPDAEIIWLPLAHLKWCHVTKEPDYYLLELYNVVDALTEQCNRLEAQVARFEEVTAQVEQWQHKEWLRATWWWRLRIRLALWWLQLIAALERRGLAMMGGNHD